MSKIVCVDFDGVIHSYASGWKGEDTVADSHVPGAFDWLESLLDDEELKPVVYSSCNGIEAMRQWFLGHGFKRLDELEFADKKPPAFVIVDDRAILFDGHFTPPALIKKFVPWNKRGDSGWKMVRDGKGDYHAYWNGMEVGGVCELRLEVKRGPYHQASTTKAFFVIEVDDVEVIGND